MSNKGNDNKLRRWDDLFENDNNDTPQDNYGEALSTQDTDDSPKENLSESNYDTNIDKIESASSENLSGSHDDTNIDPAETASSSDDVDGINSSNDSNVENTVIYKMSADEIESVETAWEEKIASTENVSPAKSSSDDNTGADNIRSENTGSNNTVDSDDNIAIAVSSSNPEPSSDLYSNDANQSKDDEKSESELSAATVATKSGRSKRSARRRSNKENTSNENMNKQKKKDKNKKKKKPIFLRILKWFLVLLLIIVIFGGVAVAGIVYSILSDAPAIDPTSINDTLTETSIMYDEDGNKIDTIFMSKNRNLVKIADVPIMVQEAFISLEDKSFREHHGFNFIRIVGAVKDALVTGGQISGTSTITQQLARNVYLPDQQFDHSYSRKITEAYYAMQIEKALSKDEILETYLNTIYFGYGCYGAQTASINYFGKELSDISIAQAAALAALPQLPDTYELVTYIPGGNPDEYADVLLNQTDTGIFIMNDKSKERREICLGLMLEQGKITESEYETAIATPLIDMLDPEYERFDFSADYFADYTIGEVISDLMEEKGMTLDQARSTVYSGGIQIYTTMDPQAQQVIIEEFANPENYPGVLPWYDSDSNILDEYGNVLLYYLGHYFDDEGMFTLPAGNATRQADGSLIITPGIDLNVYTVTVDGEEDYSLEFKDYYEFDDNWQLYSVQGGYINIPAEYKSRDSEGNLIISADFFNDENYENFMTFNEDGSITIPPSSYTLRDKVMQPQAAMTIIENSTGHVKAIVGGRGTSGRMIYNRANNVRQPGSSMKPLGVYSAALQQSYEEASAGRLHNFTDFGIDKQGDKLWGDYITAGSIVIDEKTVINGSVWPLNFDRTYFGAKTFREAMQMSLNTCAVKIWMQVGVDYSLQNIKNFGITTLVEDGDYNDLNSAALALGGMTNGVTTVEMASAYSVFPNNGVRYDTCPYTKVLNRDGSVLLENNPEMHEVLDPGVAWIMGDICRSVVLYGGAYNAAIDGVFVAGKTGTTSNTYDDWFDGFTPNYTASLWIGNDFNISLDAHSIAATYMWSKIMSRIDATYEGERMSMPSNVLYINGEYYLSGTQSGLISKDDISKTANICSDTGLLATPECPNQVSKTFYMYDKEDPESGEDDPTDDTGAPRYHCYIHNNDPAQYEVSPDKLEEVLKRIQEEKAAQEAAEQAAQEAENNNQNGGNSDNGNGDGSGGGTGSGDDSSSGDDSGSGGGSGSGSGSSGG